MIMNNYKGVIFFDLDDTLFNTTKFVNFARNESFKAMIDGGLKVNLNKLWIDFGHIYSQLGSNSSKHYDKLLEDYKVPKSDADRLVALAVMAYHRAKNHFHDFKFKNVDKILKTLKKDYILCIFSSGIGVKQWEKFYLLEFFRYFEDSNVFITDSIERSKINHTYKELYNFYSTHYNTQNLWMIGDKETADIIPAKEIGFKTIRVGTGKYRFDFEKSIADYKINDISVLLNLNLF